MYNAAQILLALMGFAGVGWFVVGRLFNSRKQAASSSRASRAVLFLGLVSWLGMTLLRHDVVAATGLVVATVLLWRFFRAQHSD